jgi:hypothetical protein
METPSLPVTECGPPVLSRRTFLRECGFWMMCLAIPGLLLGVGSLLTPWHPIAPGEFNESRLVAVSIANAIESFNGDYNRTPLPSGPPPAGGDRETDSSPSHGFIAMLIGLEGPISNPQNPRKTDYLDGIKPAKANPPGDPPWRNGLITDSKTGAYGIVDAYGNYYRIRLDTNGDKEITNPHPEQAAEGRRTMRKQVIVWSAGKDRDWNTWDDNPMSWD